MSDNINETGIKELEKVTDDTNANIILINQSKSLNNYPKLHEGIIPYPCFNIIINDNICKFYLNKDNKQYEVGKSNIPINICLLTLISFLKRLELEYTKYNYIDKDKSIDADKSNKIKNIFSLYYLDKDLIKLISHLRPYEDNIDILNFNLRFNNYDNVIYLSRLRDCFNDYVYINKCSKIKLIRDDINYNEIVSVIISFWKVFVTLINYNLYASLSLLRNNSIAIKSIVISKLIY